ncbi:MAG: hypothetical protein U1F52_17415 [Burkholderiales bacterium]
MPRLFALLVAAVLGFAMPAHAEKPAAPKVIYAVVVGVVFTELGEVDKLRVVKVVEPRKGNADAVGVTVPEEYVASVRRMLASPRYRPKPGQAKPDEVFTYFFFDPSQPDRADLDPRPRRQ